ncbi:MAG: 30S ribosomal protein S2 [bacterium]|nr:30S ribosomal protein S2 [bacterium]
MADNKETAHDPIIDALFSVGAHFGYRRSKRHPSAIPFIFGSKGGVEIFDLEKSRTALLEAEVFLKELGATGKTALFVSSKPEACEALKAGAEKINMPYVAGRWIGGTLTNFPQIRSRIDKMLDLISKREKGELSKYTKKERLLIDRDIVKLDELFAGLVPLTALPAALVVVDPGKEHTAIAEAKKTGIPVVALANSDCNLKVATYAVPGNDATRKSVAFFVERMVAAYEAGKMGTNNQ